MGKRKYDPEQVQEELELYLSTGGEKVWEKAAVALGMPVSSLKMVMSSTWPEVGAPVIETVRDQRVAKVVDLLQRGPQTRNELADAIVGYYGNIDFDQDAATGNYGPAHARLAEIKGQYDPGNLFRLNSNIEPA